MSAHWYADIGAHSSRSTACGHRRARSRSGVEPGTSSLSQAQANLTRAGMTAKRYHGLIRHYSVSQQDVDQNNQNLAAQTANVQAAYAT